MADPHNLSTDELVRKVLTDEHADLVREAVAFLCQQIMEAEVTQLIGAGLGERAPGERATHRNGYRERRFDTRAGSLELFIPKLRASAPAPSLPFVVRFSLRGGEWLEVHCAMVRIPPTTAHLREPVAQRAPVVPGTVVPLTARPLRARAGRC